MVDFGVWGFSASGFDASVCSLHLQVFRHKVSHAGSMNVSDVSSVENGPMKISKDQSSVSDIRF